MAVGLSKISKRTLASVSLIAVAFNAAMAGEPIRFSDDSKTTAPPQKKRGSDLVPPIELKPTDPGGGDVVPVMPATQPNAGSLDPRIIEWLDQEKNWLSKDPAEFDHQKALNDIFGIRNDYDFERIGQKPKSSITRYFGAETSDEPETSNTGTSKDIVRGSEYQNDDAEGSVAGSSALPIERSLRSSTTPTIEIGYDPTARNSLSGMSSMTGDMMRSSSDPLGRIDSSRFTAGFSSRLFDGPERLSGLEQRKQDFQKQLQQFNDGSPRLSTDPLNSANNGSGPVINPIAGGNALDVGLGLGSSLGGSGVNPAPSFGTVSPISSAFSSSTVAADSFGPSFSTPAPPPVVQARPPVLEIPRRKF